MSTEAMCKQAAEAAMRAYRDGHFRQTMRLRTDAVFDAEDLGRFGVTKLLKKSLPLVKSFIKKLWNGQGLKGVKASIVDGEAGTLVYREGDNPQMDSAVFYLAGRDLMIEDKMKTFFSNMGDRLVVLMNTEQAAASWQPENNAAEWGSEEDSAVDVVKQFSMRSYYYYQLVLNQWQTIFFRAYPHPWEVWIEDMNFELVKVGESPYKPDFETIVGWMREYEEANGIQVSQKIGKYLKDVAKREGPDDDDDDDERDSQPWVRES